MYKVFLNERAIIITDPANITLNKKSYFFNDLCLDELKNWFVSFVESDESEVFLVHSSPDIFFDLFRSIFISVRAAGGVVIRINRLLFIFRNGKWDLPKGKIEKGETAKEAAIREVEEECGILGHNIVKQLSATFHIYRSPYNESNGKWIFKETFWFEMDYRGAENGNPQLDEGITKVKWFARNELATVCENTYENLKQIILPYRD